MAHQLPTLVDDGLITVEIGNWGEDKYRLLHLYAQIFSVSMTGKWDCRVYIDLFAGSGRSRIKGTNRIVAGSPLVALSVDPSFDRYVFCEKDPDMLSALEKRVARDYPAAKAQFLLGDANEVVMDILNKIPQHKKDFRVLSFCFVDPFNLKDLAFDTIDRLSTKFVDFMVLIATDMDAARNVATYLLPQNEVVERFLGVADWRSEWLAARSDGQSFSSYLMNRFSRQMEARRYIRVRVDETKLVRSTEKNLPLYRLALFARHPVAKRLWEQALKYSDPQRDLF
jgi:three-Cys-motif partner protein